MKGASPTDPPTDLGPLMPGSVLWKRLRLEEELPTLGSFPLWLATDLRTQASHAVELIPIARGTHRPVWTENAALVIPPSHPALLAFYRFEADSSLVGAISAYDSRLRQPTLSRTGEALISPGQVLRWFEEVVHAVDEIHGARIRPHGAVVPSRIIVSPGQSPLLTGYPHGAFEFLDSDIPFLTPERQNGETPTRADDVFSLALLLFSLLTGGLLPAVNEEAQRADGSIDAARTARHLPVTGWANGWDKPIFNVVFASRDSRPGDARAWIDELNRNLDLPLLRPPLRQAEIPITPANARPRRSPPWRKDFRPQTISPRADDAGGSARREASSQIQEEAKELARQNEEIRRRQRELDAQTAQLAAAKATHLESEAQFAKERAAAQRKQTELEAKANSIAEGEYRLETLKRQFDQASAQLTKTQEALRAETAALAKAREQAAAKPEVGKTAGTPLTQRSEDLLDRRADEFGASRSPANGAPLPSTPEWAAAATPPPPPPPEPIFPEPRPEAARMTAESGVTPAAAPPAPPLVQENRKATLLTSTGRRIHVFGTPVLRFGRHANSDVLLVAILSGQAQPTMALNREISRKHFELQIAPDDARVIDGWSDDGKPSQHGLCVDGRRVQSGGAALRNGMLLSVTTRAPGRSVPHWKVHLFYRGGDAETTPSLSALWLQRLDDTPDDVTVILNSAMLQDFGVADVPGDLAIVTQPNGLFFRVGPELQPLAQDGSPAPGLSVLSVGWCSPTIVAPSA